MKKSLFKGLAAASIVSAVTIGFCTVTNAEGNDSRTLSKIAGDESVTIVGFMATNGDYENPQICTFSSTGTSPVETLAADNVEFGTRGGFQTPDGYFYTFGTLNIFKYDPGDWSAGVVEKIDLQLGNFGFPRTATYDITTGTAYICLENKRMAWADQSYCLASVDLTTGEVNKLVEIPGGDNGRAYGMAADARGNLYMILPYDSANPNGSYPALYKVDTQNYTFTNIGQVVINVGGFFTAAACQMDTGRLFFAADVPAKGAIYEIDVETGAATLTRLMPNDEQFGSIYIPYTFTEGAAPDVLRDLSVVQNDAAGNATVTFTIPLVSYSGDTLTGEVSYTIAVDGKTLATGSGTPGAKVEKSISLSGNGETAITVTLTAGGKSTQNEVVTFIGNDTPAIPTGITATADGNTVTVSWNPVAEGAHGGYVATADLTYDVTLQPGDISLGNGIKGNSVTSTLTFDRPVSLMAEVKASCSGLEGTAGKSDSFVAGPGFNMPYSQTFSSDDSMDLFTIADIDNDGATWVRYKGDGEAYAQCLDSDDRAKNDWLFTPAMHLERGQQYTLDFKASSLMVNVFTEILEVKMGDRPTPGAMSATLLEPQPVANKQSWTWHDYSLTLQVEETGDYYIGFHAMSEAAQFRLAIDDILIQGSQMDAPAPVTELFAVGETDGSYKATVTFRTPSLTNAGAPVGELENAEVYVNNRPAKTVEKPAADSEVTVEVATEDGDNIIDVYTSNAAGKSIAATVNVFSGRDYPGAPRNVKARVAEEGVVIIWERPEGARGGYLEGEVTYTLGRYINGEITVLAVDLPDTYTFTDDYEAEYQTVVTYAISASNEIGDSPTSSSNSIVVGGESYELPLRESFGSGFASYMWQNQIVNMAGYSSWRTYNPEYDAVDAVADGDLGSICFHPIAEGNRTRIFSGKVNLKNAVHPVLEFWYKGAGSAGQKLLVEVNPDMMEWSTLREYTLTDASDSWQQVKLPLDDFRGRDSFQFAFQGIADNLGFIYVDNISIRDVRENDLEVALSTRRNFHYGQSETISAIVSNVGEKAADAYKVEFYSDDKLIATLDGGPLAVDAAETLTTEHAISLGDADEACITVKAVYAADNFLDNNTASSDAINHLPLYPAPTEVKGVETGGNVSLGWNAPEPWREPDYTAVTENFDSCEPFIIDEIGDWLTVDENGAEGTYGILGLAFPHREAAKSWQVFNLRALGVDPDEEDTTWDGHSGQQFLVAFADKDGKNDDWLISPALSGKKQTVSFWMKSISTFWYGNETYEVLASSTDREISSFVSMKSGDVGQEWTEISVELPAGTRYFAIKCTSADKYVMALDDITYIPGSGLFDEFDFVGYNIYKNVVKVNETVINEESYSCAGNLEAEYAVTALYTTGESRFAKLNGADAVSGVYGDGISVSGGKGVINVRGAEGQSVAVIAADGRIVAQTLKAEADLTFDLPSGIYVVNAGGKTEKVIVY